MMRYQRVSPDCLPMSNGKRPSMDNGRSIPSSTTNGAASSSSSLEPKALRFRSPSRTAPDNHHQSCTFDNNNNNNSSHLHQHHETTQQRPESSPSPSPSPGRGGDILLQWGQKKRSRASRTEIRALTDDSSSSSAAALKPQRRVVGPSEKLHATAMPPPPPPAPPIPSSTGRTRKDASGSLPSRNLEDQAGAVNGSPSRNHVGNSRAASRSLVGKRSPPLEKNERKNSLSARSANEKANGSSTQADRSNQIDSAALQTEQEGGGTHPSAAPKEEKVNLEAFEWPRIYIGLSRKEKEDDFLVMKGTKLPQRPKKRAKNIDRALQYCFPGMWLSDLTRNRYEVREKKCVKKQKRRGLKGMESVDSDSE